jgi:hypothetical protein
MIAVDTTDRCLRVTVAACMRTQLAEGVVLPSRRFIRFAKIVVLIVDIWTLACAALVVGWQGSIFYREGNWQTLPLSLVFSIRTHEYRDGDVHSTGSVGQSGATNVADALFQLPIITVLLLAAAFLTAFYLWLYKTEKQLTGT